MLIVCRIYALTFFIINNNIINEVSCLIVKVFNLTMLCCEVKPMRDELFKIHYSNMPFNNNNLLQIYFCGHYRHEADKTPFYREKAQGYQIFYSVTGKGWLNYDGKDNTIEPGDVVCIDLNKRHGIGAFPGYIWEHYWCMLGGLYFEEIYDILFGKSNIIKSENCEKINHLFIDLFSMRKADDRFFDMKGTLVIMQILCDLLPVNRFQTKEDQQQANQVENTIKYMKNNLGTDINLAQLSKISGYSPSRYSDIFKKITGISPGKYLLKKRMDYARKLLLETDLSVDIIAEMVGFKTRNAFITSFKKHTFITPGKFRKSPQFY